MRHMKNFIYNFSDIFVALLIIALAAFLIWTRIDVIMAYPDTPSTFGTSESAASEESSSTSDSRNITIAKGCSTEEIASALKENNVISDESYFISTLRSMKLEGKIESGTYVIPIGSSIENLINILCKVDTTADSTSKADYKEVTIPKGSSVEVVAGLLKQANITTDTNSFTNMIKSKKLEGKIEPGVYKIPNGSSMEDVVNILCKISSN